MTNVDKIGFGVILAIIVLGFFLFGFGVGVAIGQEMQNKDQKTLLIEQNNLLKEHIALQDEMLKFKELAE